VVPRAVIFVGPSLRTRGPIHPDLCFEAPAVRGDLDRAADRGVAWIGLVDGELFQRAAVTPREVRAVAARGVRLWGAASVGALRAVECPDAMTGIGRVFEAYRDGRLVGDDEVAMTYDRETYAVVASPLVNIRAAFAAGVVAGWWPRAAAERAVAAVQRLPFHARDRAAILAAASAAQLPRERVLQVLADPANDVKTADARLLVEMLERALG
jgi:hypothetical protein